MSDEEKYKITIRATKHAYNLSIPAVFRDRLRIQKGDNVLIEIINNKMYVSKSSKDGPVSKVHAAGNGKSMNFTIPIGLVAQHNLETCPTLDVYLKDEYIIYELT